MLPFVKEPACVKVNGFKGDSSHCRTVETNKFAPGKVTSERESVGRGMGIGGRGHHSGVKTATALLCFSSHMDTRPTVPGVSYVRGHVEARGESCECCVVLEEYSVARWLRGMPCFWGVMSERKSTAMIGRDYLPLGAF